MGLQSLTSTLFVFFSLLGFLSMKGTGQIRYYARMTIYLVDVLIASAVGITAAVPMILVGRRFDIQWLVARTFGELARLTLGLTFVVEGAEHLNTPSAVFLGNHQSMLDLAYLGGIYPKRCSIMAKSSLKWTPLLGQFMTLSGAVFIDRGNSKKALKSMAQAGGQMKRDSTSVWVFPEGTRTLTRASDLLPFKKGAFHLAVQGGVPLVPIVCENYWKLYHTGVFESGVLRIRVLPLISTAGLNAEDVSALATRARDMMLEALNDISTAAPSDISVAQKGAVISNAKPISDPAPPLASSNDTLEVDAPAPLSTLPEGIRERRPEEGQQPLHFGGHRRRDSSSAGGTSTSEEDDGLVIVDRPSS